eukprot:gene9020-8150_t
MANRALPLLLCAAGTPAAVAQTDPGRCGGECPYPIPENHQCPD